MNGISRLLAVGSGRSIADLDSTAIESCGELGRIPAVELDIPNRVRLPDEGVPALLFP